MSVTIKGEPKDLVSSVRMEDLEGPHGRVTVWNRGANAGTLTLAKADAVKVAFRLLGPNVHEHVDAGTILDRCISLVQSIAKQNGDGVSLERLDAYEAEASQICADAGWT